MKFGTQDQYNMALWKIKFSELLRQALPWQPHISGEIISFSFSFCSFNRLAWNLAHRTDITCRCENLNFRNCYASVAMATTHIGGGGNNFIFIWLLQFLPDGMKFGLAHRTDITGMVLWKIEFSELLRQALPWQPHISGKIISFSFSFCSFYPIGMKFGTQDRYNMALWKIELSELLCQALPWQPHISGKIAMKFGTQDRYNMTLWKIEFSELLHQALPWHPHISGGNNFIFI